MKQTAYIVDIDGTIADKGNRDPYDWSRVGEDQPIQDVIEVVRYLGQHRSIIFVSGRMEQCRLQTELWLRFHYRRYDTGPYEALFMRPDGDLRPDVEVKEEIYRRHIEPSYIIQGVFDDRNSVVAMWRRLGLTCFQVAEGDF